VSEASLGVLAAACAQRRGAAFALVAGESSLGEREPLAVVDALLVAAGLRPVGESLLTVDAVRAHELVELMLTKDLAYGRERLDRATAKAAASAAVSFAGDGASYFTNRFPDDVDDDHPLGTDSVSVSAATFDAVVIAIGATAAVLVVVRDED
jgi:hypothetical protein